METLNTYRGGPDGAGHFGIFGGRFVAETLMPLILDVERAYNAARKDASFQADYDYYAKHYVGRPSPLYYAERLTAELRKGADPETGAKIRSDENTSELQSLMRTSCTVLLLQKKRQHK